MLGLLTEKYSREVLHPRDAALPECLGLEEEPAEDHAELLLVAVSTVRNRSFGTFIPALLRYFRHA